jgi:hypothetical protein
VSCICIFVSFLLFLVTSFDLSLSLHSKRSSDLSSPVAQLSMMSFLAQDGDDVFSATMPTPKPSSRHGGFSLKKKSAR